MPGLPLEGLKQPVTKWMGKAYEAVLLTLDDDIRALEASGSLDLAGNPAAVKYLANELVLVEDMEAPTVAIENIRAEDLKVLELGQEIYDRDGLCATCHGEDGKGAVEDIYPPLDANTWVNGDPERLIKLTLKGLYGPLTLDGKTYGNNESVPPMPGFGGMLSDEEVAAALSYIRIRLGRMGTSSARSSAGMIESETVASVRRSVADRENAYEVKEILEEHPNKE